MLENSLPGSQSDVQTWVGLAPEHASGYQVTVKPERVIVIPGYALRLLRHGDLSPKEMSLWVAFRQATYSSWREAGSKAKYITENIPYWKVLRFAMMSRASFFREVTGQTVICGGLVEAEDSLPDPDASRQVANSLRYKVNMSPRLTKRDCGILQAELVKAATGHVGDEAMRQVEKALAGLLARNPGDYLDNPHAQVEPGTGWPRTIAEIVRQALGAKILPDLLRKMAENLQERIVAGYGNVVITHYFLQVAAPGLGLSHAQAWTVIILRDRVWFDYTTGERWPFAVVHGGLDDLASMTGSSVKSVRRWFDEPGFGALISIQKTPARVELPEYWDARTLVLYASPLEPLLAETDKMSNALGQNEQPAGTKRTASRDKMSNAVGQNEQWGGTKRVMVRDKMSNDSGQNEQLLNNFYKRYISFNNRHRQPAEGQNETRFSAAADSDLSEKTNPERWTLRELAEANTINGKKVTALHKAGTDPEALAQWLAEAYTKTSLTNPIGYAVQNALEYPGGKNLRQSLFSRRPKSEILQKLAYALAGYPMPDDAEFVGFVRKYSRPNLHNLFLALGGNEPDIPPQFVRSAPEPRPAATVALEPAEPVKIPEHVYQRGEELLARLRSAQE